MKIKKHSYGFLQAFPLNSLSFFLSAKQMNFQQPVMFDEQNKNIEKLTKMKHEARTIPNCRTVLPTIKSQSKAKAEA